MREQEFKNWLSHKMRDISATNWVRAIQRIEKDEGIDLDEQFKKDGMASIIKLYTYTIQDERNNRPNPAKIENNATSLRSLFSAHKSALNHYRRFCLGGNDAPIPQTTDNDNSTDIETTETGATFGLERDLQDAIRENITQLEAGLEIIDNGLERKVASGYIDILAKDKNGNFVIIELKAGAARDAVIAQILGYMGDIAQEENQPVRGIIIAEDFNQRLRSTLHASPNLNLELKSYRYTFDFKNET